MTEKIFYRYFLCFLVKNYRPVFKRKRAGDWWRQSGSNRRPFECHSNALPTALCPHLKFTFSLYRRAINLSREFVRHKIPAFPSFEFDRILCYTFKKKSRKGRKIKLCWNGSGKRRMCGSIYRTPKNRL